MHEDIGAGVVCGDAVRVEPTCIERSAQERSKEYACCSPAWNCEQLNTASVKGLPLLTRLAGAGRKLSVSAFYPRGRRRSRPTVRVRQSPRGADRTDALRICAVCELEPILGVGLEVSRLYLQGEVHVGRGERFAGIERPAREVGVVEDLERYADRNALVRHAVDWNGARPQQDRIVEGVALSRT